MGREADGIINNTASVCSPYQIHHYTNMKVFISMVSSNSRRQTILNGSLHEHGLFSWLEIILFVLKKKLTWSTGWSTEVDRVTGGSTEVDGVTGGSTEVWFRPE